MSRPVDVALVVVEGASRRAVTATLSDTTTVEELATALEVTAPLYRHEQLLDPASTLVDVGVLSGDEIGVGAPVAVDWRQLRPELRVIGGVATGSRLRLDGRRAVVGRGAEAHLVLPNPRVSRAHAEFALCDEGFTVRDLGSRNGIEIDGRSIASDVATRADFGAVVRVGDSLLTVAPVGDGAATLRRADAFHLAFDGGRTPRGPERPSDPVAPTTGVTPTTRRSIVPFAVPTAGAIAVAASTAGAPPSVAFTATPVAVLATYVAERALQARDARRVRATEDARAQSAADDFRSALLDFARAARALAPDPAALLALIEHRGSRLWSMPAADASLRVGVAADGHAWLPVAVRLSAEPVVLAGSEPSLDALLHWMVVQAASLISPRELDVLVVTDSPSDWAWTAWLPHRGEASVVAADAAPNELPTRRAARRLIVLDRPTSPRWRSDPALSLDDLVVWRTNSEQDVPFNASTVVSAASPVRARIEGADGVRDDVVIDALSESSAFASRAALGLARLQSPFSAAVASGPIPLTDVVPALASSDAVIDQWRRAAGPLRVALGSDDLGLLEITLDGQNSHALIAGTTGSGKTRLLESLVLSLASSRSPAELNVLIIDFKGGNELAALTALPHCVGLVSDRNVSEVDRAVSALTREIARRDDLFAAAGASDLADYRSTTGALLPRLVVIADEFGQFRRDDTLGGRVATLLRIAAQGRSKGIHLVLATQSPSTDVTAEIRQNVGVRVCLRVAEAAESVAVLGTPDAAQLPGPGHVLVAADNEMRRGRVATAQTALEEDAPVRVTALVDAAVGVGPIMPSAGRRLLDVAIDNITSAADRLGTQAPVLLAPPLAPLVVRRALPHAQRQWTTGGLVVGARDRPGIAEPAPFCFDLARDVALTVVGGPRSGRTTALLALAEAARDQADPKSPLVVHAIAWASGLEALDGTQGDAGVVRRGDFDHLRRTITWLSKDAEDNTTRLVLIDRLDLLLRDMRELDGGALAAHFVEVLNDGQRRRVATAATVEPAALLTTTAVLAGPRLVLPVDDATLAAASGVPHRPDSPPGRGVIGNGDAVQVGVPAETVRREDGPVGKIARMPRQVPFASIGGSEGERVAIGLGGLDRLHPVVVDLDAVGPVIVVVGRAGSGRSAALQAFASAYAGNRHVLMTPDALPDRPSFLLIDDAVRAAASRPWLDADDFPDLLRAGGHVAAIAYDQADLTSLGYRHWLTKRTYPGLLLSLDATPDRIVAGERLGFLPPAELRVGPAGRGWWCWRGTGVPVQVATI